MSEKRYQIAKPIPKGRSQFTIVEDAKPGVLGGHRSQKLYGRLDCPIALRYVAKGTYQKNRVFFHSEEEAVACGFHPCSICLPEKHRAWKAEKVASEGS